MRSPEVPDEPSLAELLSSALVSVRAGQITDALAALARVRADTAATTEPVADSLSAAALIDCRLARGDIADAVAVGREIEPLLSLVGPPGAVARHARGELAAALGEAEEAVDHFTAAGARLAGSEELTDPTLVPWRASLAMALVRVGQVREGGVLAQEWHEIAVASGSPYTLAHALRTLATVGSGGDRIKHLRTARESLAGIEAYRLAAQIDTDLAGLLLLDPSSASHPEALHLLRSAEAYAGGQELWPLQSRVRRLLERMGEQPRRLQTEAMAALTVAERRVALLAADGLTNRQIAEELVVTVKAVEWHLSHIYRKLGIPSRSGLAATLGTPV